jgi:hypothetical protein
MRRPPFASLLLFLAFAFGLVLVAEGRAAAAPQAKILRVDPRAGLDSGAPLLTTVVEVVQFKPLADVLLPCASSGGTAATMSCWSGEIEKPGNLYTPAPPAVFEQGGATLMINVGGSDTPTTFVDKAMWKDSKKLPNVGTAWLITLDATSAMGSRYKEARAVAYAFLNKMEPNDLVDLMIFDGQVIADSKWQTYQNRNAVVATLDAHQNPESSRASGDRGLFSIIQQMTQDAFGSLGNWDTPAQIPLHQAMVVLSNGSGKNDAASTGPTSTVFSQYLDNGRFPENNTSLPRTPLPVVSIWFPNGSSGIIGDVYNNNESQFMRTLANPEIGGFFDVVQEGQGAAKGPTIIGLVKQRFDQMWLVHWKLACLNPTVTQSFNLIFTNVKQPVGGDATMKDVPIGVDPTQWPLDVDAKMTQDAATKNPIVPGGTFTVYGNFCWGTEPNRAAAYFIPDGTQPPATNSRDPNTAKKAQQELVARGLAATATKVGDTFATYTVPDNTDVLIGTGDNTVSRIVLYDSVAHRVSSVDPKTILTLKASTKALNWAYIGGGAGILIVVVLLLVVVFRGGGGGARRRPAPPTPAAPPPQAPAPYGAPYGGGAPPPGGYGMSAAAPPSPPVSPLPAAAPPPQPMYAPPAAAPPAAQASPPPLDGGSAPAVVQVKCPACQMMTMATPGQPSVCFSCGQPLPASITGGGGGGNAPAFPLTGGMPAQPAPPPNPYSAAAASAATITGESGQFTVRPGAEVRVGRDPAQCPIFLSHPRVSGVHSTLKFEAAQLWVRDESSNNGTFIAGSRIPAGNWVPVPGGSQLRFGPIEFMVQLEA